MALRLGDGAPDFEAQSTKGNIQFHAWLGKSWGILFWHPTNFTAVSASEITATARVQSEFQKRDIRPLVISIDPLRAHQNYVKDLESVSGLDIGFPLVADPEARVARLYDLLDQNSILHKTVRTLFIIDPHKKIRLTLTYPVHTGMNLYEILRVCDALQLTENHLVATPADWYQGQDVFVLPSLSEIEAAERFPKGIQKINKYCIRTPQPNK